MDYGDYVINIWFIYGLYMVYIWIIYVDNLWIIYGSGWWYTYPSEKYGFVNWDDYSQYVQYMEK